MTMRNTTSAFSAAQWMACWLVLPWMALSSISSARADTLVVPNLTLPPIPISPNVPANPNQSNAASVLNNAFPAATGDLLMAHDALLALSPSLQQQALNEISGVSLAASPTLALFQTQSANDLLLSRLFDLFGDEAGQPPSKQANLPLQLAFDGSNEDLRPFIVAAASSANASAGGKASLPVDGTWIQANGNWGVVEGDINAPGSSSAGGGATIGYDRLLDSGVRLGAAFNYGHANGQEDGKLAGVQLNSYKLIGYGGYEDGPLVMAGALDVGVQDFKTKRDITLVTDNSVATASYGGQEVSASGQVGYRFPIENGTLTPYISLDYVYLHQNGFTESGAGSLDLIVQASHFNSLQPEAGILIGRTFALDQSDMIVTEAHAGFRYELLDATANSAALLAGATSSGTLDAQGVALARAMGHLGAKLIYRAQAALDIYVAYDAELSGNQTQQTAGIGFRYLF